MWMTDGDTTDGEGKLIPLYVGPGSGGDIRELPMEPDRYALAVTCPETWWNEAACIDLAKLTLYDENGGNPVNGVDAFFQNNCVEVTVTLHLGDFALDYGAKSRPGMTLIVCGNSAGSAYDNSARVALGFPGVAWTSPAWVTSILVARVR